MAECVVPTRWRWYQVSGVVGTMLAGVAFLIAAGLGGNVALSIIGGAWLVLAALGVRRLVKLAWSVKVEDGMVTIRGPRLHQVLPASDVRAVRLVEVIARPPVLVLDTATSGRIRCGPLPAGGTELIVELETENPRLLR